MSNKIAGYGLGLAMAGAVVLSACSGGSGAAQPQGQQPAAAAPPPQALAVKAQNLKFAPETLTVKAGQPVKVTVTNADALEHDFNVRGLDTPVKIVTGPNATADGTFTPTKAGTYEFFCSVPGHEAAGMKGTLTVQ